jgi:hypothetical protein
MVAIGRATKAFILTFFDATGMNRSQISDRPVNRPTHTATFDANFAGNGAT